MNNYRFGQGLKTLFLDSREISRKFVMLHVAVFLAATLLSLIVFLAGQANGLKPIIQEYLLVPAQLSGAYWKVYTLFTHIFFGQDVFALLFNMLWLFWIGQIFLSFFKTRDFYIVYLGSAFFAGIGFYLAYQFLSALHGQQDYLAGPAAAVMGIMVATVTMVPQYRIPFLFIGQVKLLYLVLGYIFLDLLGVENGKAGATIAHLCGAAFAFLYVKLKLYQRDWRLFKRTAKPKIKVVKNDIPPSSKTRSKKTEAVDQAQIDAILDKISVSGYEKLSREEKEILFKASKN